MVGTPEIDLTHEKLFTLVNKMIQVKAENQNRKRLETAVYAFLEQLYIHFNHEEEYLAAEAAAAKAKAETEAEAAEVGETE